jgi:hypothetical protein
MSASPPPLHRVGILMAPTGRFLVCRDCKLSFEFSEAGQYSVIAKQFELHSCDASGRHLVIVRYERKVPVMASCSNCERKFFTPTLMFERDAVGAEQYLAHKFDMHRCEQRNV